MSLTYFQVGSAPNFLGQQFKPLPGLPLELSKVVPANECRPHAGTPGPATSPKRKVKSY